MKKNFYNIISTLKKMYPNAGCSLVHKNVFELLIATILSAQCTDERVNKVTPELFKKYPDAKEMANADITDLERLIHSTGFYKHKALSLKEASQKIVKDFNGKVPNTKEELLTLRGVADKTANVVMGTGYAIASGIVVDTHVKRLSFRMGFTKQTVPEKIEKELISIVDKSDWIWFSHALILHGRASCNAKKPQCDECAITAFCPKKGIN